MVHGVIATMPTSGIVPIPCAAATEGVVQLPADSKHPSKLSGAWARQAAQRKVLEHVSLSHGNRVVQRKSPPLVGFNSLPVASLLSPVTAAASPPMSQVVPLIKDCSLQCLLCTYEQDFVPGSRMCVMRHSTWRRIHCAPQSVGKSKLVVRTRGSDKSDCPNCRLAKWCKACRLAR